MVQSTQFKSNSTVYSTKYTAYRTKFTGIVRGSTDGWDFHGDQNIGTKSTVIGTKYTVISTQYIVYGKIQN